MVDCHARICLFLVLGVCVLSEINTSKWHGRSVYFVFTDRFAKSDDAGDFDEKCDGKAQWCGGTLQGIIRKLDYIHGMGFDAIWIAPPVKQVDWLDNYNGTAYHGYWASDFFQIDPHVGTEDDLVALKQECQKRGMLLMVDIVANHVGPIHSVAQVKQLGARLNSATGGQFHQLGRRPDQSLESYIQAPTNELDAGSDCWPYYNFEGDCDHTIILEGWFGDLADLNQDDPATREYLLEWIDYMTRKYDIDGYRLDTALYMSMDFLREFQQASDRYMIGEVVTYNMSLHRSFAESALTGLLNFPITLHLKHIFSSDGNMVDLQTLLEEQDASAYPDPHLLGNFVDNHDGERFLHNHSGSVTDLMNGLAWTMLYHGLPIIYYGTEQPDVSNQSDERTSMWPAHFGRTALSEHITQLNGLRKQYGLAAGGSDATEMAVIVHSSEHHLAFVRGKLMVLVANAGAGLHERMCIQPSQLPGRWSGICSTEHPLVVLGQTSVKFCEDGLVCLSSNNAMPVVFALEQDSKLVI